jgi:methyl-accepting chemotaxis protein
MEHNKKLSLKSKILSYVAMGSLLATFISISGLFYFIDQEKVSGLLAKARTIHFQLDGVKTYVAQQRGFEQIVKEYKAKFQSHTQLSQSDKEKVLVHVPIYAAMKTGAENSTKDKYDFRVFSLKPRKKENIANEAEKKVFEYFANNPNSNEFIHEESGSISVYRPARLKEELGCLVCHGDPVTSPWGNGFDILGYQMENYKDNHLHGVFEIRQKIENDFTKTSFLTLLFLIIGVAVGSFFVIMAFVNKPMVTLVEALKLLMGTNQKLNEASTEIASTSVELSQATTEQAASLQETASSLEEINAMIGKSAENAKITADSSEESHKKAEKGKVAVQEMLSSVKDISTSNEELLSYVLENNKKMESIVQIIQEIANKTKVIDEIVFQTKLLSFNASVEAARAGDHGKGFAVVAQEVGNLAQMSGNSSKEISELLTDSLAKVHQIVAETKSKVDQLFQVGKEKVDSGIANAQNCAGILEEIVSNVAKVNSLAKDISLMNQEQSVGVTEINKTMAQLDIVTHQNSQTSELTAASAEKLHNEADALRKIVDDLAYLVMGDQKNKISHTSNLKNDKSGSKSKTQTETKSVPIVKGSATKTTKSTKSINFQSQSNKSGQTSQELSQVEDKELKAPPKDHSGFEDI